MLWGTPNLLTVSRIVAIPVFIAVFFVEGFWSHWLTAAIFVAAATTDYLDGHLARRWSMQSPLGRCFDPIADKLLVAAAIVMLVAFDRAPLLPALVIVGREIAVSGLREFLAEVRVGLPVSRLAKWKTGVQMGAIALLLVGNAAPLWLYVAEIGNLGLWVAAILTLVTGYDYLRVGLKHMAPETPAIGGVKPTGRP